MASHQDMYNALLCYEIISTQGGVGFDPYGAAVQVKTFYTGYRSATLTLRAWYSGGVYHGSLTLT